MSFVARNSMVVLRGTTIGIWWTLRITLFVTLTMTLSIPLGCVFVVFLLCTGVDCWLQKQADTYGDVPRIISWVQMAFVVIGIAMSAILLCVFKVFDVILGDHPVHG